MRNGVQAWGWSIAATLAVPLAAASCSGSSGSHAASTGSSRPQACTYVAKLDTIAATVGAADVHDPVAFNKTFATAVSDYVSNLHQLRPLVPADIQPSIDRVAADVQQYRFSAAATDRASLNAYAASKCGRTVNEPTTSTGSTAATTTTVVPSVPSTASNTPTTAPSDG